MSGRLWLQVDVGLGDDPRVTEAAAELGLAPDHLAGILLRIWGFTLQHAPSGVIEGRNPGAILENAGRWPGDRGELVRVLNEFDLIGATKTRIEMRGWVERYGRLAVVREKAKTKKRLQRLKKSAARPQGRPGAGPGDVPQMSPGERREEKREAFRADALSEPERPESSNPPPPPGGLRPPPSSAQKPVVVVAEESRRVFLEKAADIRHSRYPGSPAPSDFTEPWISEAVAWLMERDGSTESQAVDDLLWAYATYLDDPTLKAAESKHPDRVFKSPNVWRSRTTHARANPRRL